MDYKFPDYDKVFHVMKKYIDNGNTIESLYSNKDFLKEIGCDSINHYDLFKVYITKDSSIKETLEKLLKKGWIPSQMLKNTKLPKIITNDSEIYIALNYLNIPYKCKDIYNDEKIWSVVKKWNPKDVYVIDLLNNREFLEECGYEYISLNYFRMMLATKETYDKNKIKLAVEKYHQQGYNVNQMCKNLDFLREIGNFYISVKNSKDARHNRGIFKNDIKPYKDESLKEIKSVSDEELTIAIDRLKNFENENKDEILKILSKNGEDIKLYCQHTKIVEVEINRKKYKIMQVKLLDDIKYFISQTYNLPQDRDEREEEVNYLYREVLSCLGVPKILEKNKWFDIAFDIEKKIYRIAPSPKGRPTDDEKKHTITFRLTDEEKEKLEKKLQIEKMTISDYIRNAFKNDINKDNIKICKNKEMVEILDNKNIESTDLPKEFMELFFNNLDDTQKYILESLLQDKIKMQNKLNEVYKEFEDRFVQLRDMTMKQIELSNKIKGGI